MAGIDAAIDGDFRRRGALVARRGEEREQISWLIPRPIGRVDSASPAEARWGASHRGKRALPRTTLAVSIFAHVVVAMMVLLARPSERPAAPPESSFELVFEPAAVPSATVPQAEPEPVVAEPSSEAPLPPVEPIATQAEPPPAAVPAEIVPPQPVAPPVPRHPVATRHVVSRSVPAPSRVSALSEAPAPTVEAPIVAPLIPPRPVAGMETNRAPAYPESALRRGEQGRVVLRVLVSADGAPMNVTLAETSGIASLDAAAESAVRQWRFSPATQGGRPVPASADVPVRFRLTN